jgi:hypothetical protein
VDELDGEMVVAVEIDEIPATQKPCLYKPAGRRREHTYAWGTPIGERSQSIRTILGRILDRLIDHGN